MIPYLFSLLLLIPDVGSSVDTDFSMKSEGHHIFNQLLQKQVKNGKVNYTGLKKNKSELDIYIQWLSTNPPGDSQSRNEKLAFWINAYNAFTLKLIVDNYPVTSITDIDNGNPWDTKWITIGGQTLSLNKIEHEIIRPEFQEPRIHFAVNCAATSCPPLASKAYTADNLEELLEQQTRAFINNPAYNQISKNKLAVSKIFDWYGEDFGDLISFLNKYSDVKIIPTAKVSFMDYDWKLNSK